MGLPQQREWVTMDGLGKPGNMSEQIASASPLYLNKSDLLYKNAIHIKPIDGFEDVVCHGDSYGFAFKDANGKESLVSANEFSKIIKETPSYGGGANGVAAQAMANSLGVDILAPYKKSFRHKKKIMYIILNWLFEHKEYYCDLIIIWMLSIQELHY